MSWQDISTAPKDGTWILVFKVGRQYVARWEGHPYFDWAVSTAHTDGRENPFTGIGEKRLGGHILSPGPSHWMPLPQPPEPRP